MNDTLGRKISVGDMILYGKQTTHGVQLEKRMVIEVSESFIKVVPKDSVNVDKRSIGRITNKNTVVIVEG